MVDLKKEIKLSDLVKLPSRKKSPAPMSYAATLSPRSRCSSSPRRRRPRTGTHHSPSAMPARRSRTLTAKR